MGDEEIIILHTRVTNAHVLHTGALQQGGLGDMSPHFKI